MKRAAGQALIIGAVVFTIVAVLVTLTGCQQQPTQMDNCLTWISTAHPELDSDVAVKACVQMLTDDPSAFKE